MLVVQCPHINNILAINAMNTNNHIKVIPIVNVTIIGI